jgi:hypothetical protein
MRHGRISADPTSVAWPSPYPPYYCNRDTASNETGATQQRCGPEGSGSGSARTRCRRHEEHARWRRLPQATTQRFEVAADAAGGEASARGKGTP